MRTKGRSRFVGAGFVLLLAGLIAAPAFADTEFKVLFDLDHDPTTGCNVATVEGTFFGVEQQLVTTVSTANPLTVVSVARQSCTTPPSTFEPLVPVTSPHATPWPVGIANGTGGLDVVETYFPLAGVPHGVYRLGFTSQILPSGAEDAVLTTDGTATGDPILIANQSVLEIPTLDVWGLGALALLLLAAAFGVLRRRRSRSGLALALLLLTAGLGVAWATLAPDGDPSGWAGHPPLATDAPPPVAVNAEIGAVFGALQYDAILLRIDADLEADAAPTVTATTPPAGATGVAGNASLSVTFSEPVAVVGSWFQIACTVSGTRNVADAVVAGGPTTFTIDPNADFAGGETCTLTVFAAQVTDQDTNDPPDTMAADASAGFAIDAAPAVAATAPANGATQVGTQTDLTITFSEPVNVTGNWFQLVCAVSGTRNVADTAVSGGPTTFTVDPNTDFAAGESCTLTVFAAQVADQDGSDPPDLMAADFVATFGADLAPAVTSTTPADGATDRSAGADLSVTFSEPVGVSGNWFQIVCTASGTRNVADTVVTGGPLTFTIDPSVDFTAGESCTWTLFAAQVADQDTGDPPDNMAADVAIGFTIDSAPSVAATTPANGGSAALDADLSITFSEPVNLAGNWLQIVCSVSGTRNVADTVVSGGPTTFTVNPNTDFAGGDSCTATVFAAPVADQDASDPPDTMAADHVFTFSADAAPAVSSTTPTNGAVDQATTTDLAITFSENVDVTGNWFQIVCTSSGTRNVADTVVTGGPLTFTINPSSDFAAGESCTVTVFAAQVADQDANDPPDTMAANHVFGFSLDAVPGVTATNPANGATGVSVATNLVVTFSEPVNVTGNWFQIVCGVSGTRNVADTAVSGGPTVFTIDPIADFSAGESCTLTVLAAQVADQDLSDPPDAMAANFSASFATDAAPFVSATIPANAATDAATSQNLTITFSEPVNAAGNWFQIVCATSGTRNVADTAVAGGPTSFTIDPATDFAPGELCTTTVFAAQVNDQDLSDPPDGMLANHVFAFTVDQSPAVSSTTPPAGGVTTASATLTVTFSEPVDVAGNWFQIVCATSGTRNVADTAVTGGPTTFTIDPNVDFVAPESCALTVFAAQVTDQDAADPPDAMAADHLLNFSVDAAPSVVGTIPADTATNQAIDTNLTITFSENVNVAGNWFQIVCTSSGTRNVADTVVTGGPLAFTIDPNVDFATAESCTVTVFAPQVTDQDAFDPPDTMAANYVFSFATDAPPSVTAETPVAGATDQVSTTNLTVTFSEAVNVAGNWFQIVCAVSGTRNVADTVVTGGPTTFTINPNADFAPGESCTTTILAAQVADQDTGDPPDNMAANHSWTFSVDAAPSVTATTPVNGATQQPTTASLTVTFSEPVNVTGGWFQIVCTTSGTHNVGSTVVAGGPTTFTIDPNVDFAAGETCTTTIFASQVADQDANDPPDNMVANHIFSFAIDAAPSVLSTTPANGAIDQANNTNIGVTFSEPVAVAGNWFQIVCTASGTRNPADTVVSGGPTAYAINPNVDFSGNETCTVTVFAAAVTDVDAGDPPDNMSADYAFSFTIVNTPPVANPDAYDLIGNTQLQVSNADTLTDPHVYVSGGVLGNDSDADGPSPLVVSSLTVGSCTTTSAPFSCFDAAVGQVDMDTGGHFTFTPVAGDSSATETFQYTASDGVAGTVATVTLTLHERVWYVENNAAAGGLGRSNDPFDTLAEAQTASLANDWIFVYFGNGNTTGQDAGIVLKAGQHLLGEHVGLTIPISSGSFNGTPAPTTVPLVPAAAGNRPWLDNTAAGGNAVSATDAIPTEIAGLNLAGNANGIDLTTNAAFAGSGATEIRDNVVRSSGAEGIDVNVNGNGANVYNLSIHDNDVTAGTRGIDVFRTAGTARITAFDDNVIAGNTGGSGIELNGVIFDATPGNPINTVAGGTTVVGQPGNGVSTNGILLASVVGDLSFTDLDVYNDAGAGLRVTSTGALNAGAGTGFRVAVGAAVATIDSTGGPAVDVSGASVSLPLAFLRSANSPTTGLSLVNAFGGAGSTALSVSSGQITDPVGGSGTAVNISGGNGNVTLGIPITNTSGNAVAVASRTSDTVALSGAISETGSGISLTNNTGATISFTGAITASTGSTTAFNATGGGTVTATDTTSTLATTTAAALYVTNTTIGSGGLRFRSISANGAANGIVLNNTGASGNLSVLGAGAADSGGVIQNTTGAGISLTSTQSPSFTRMRIQNTAGSGVDGTQVTNFTFTNGTIDNSGTGLGAETSNIAFNDTGAGTERNLSGTVTITGNTLTNAYFHGIDIFNFNGTIDDATISSNTITSTNSTATSKGSGIRFVAFGSATTVANVTRATIANNVVSNFPSAAGIMAQGGNGNLFGPAGVFGTAGSATNLISITGNRVAGFSAVNRIGTQAIIGVVNGKGQGSFDISTNGTVANPITNTIGTAIALSSLGQANVTATVTNNVIVANNTVGASGIGAGTSQTWGSGDTPSLTVTITGNQISQTDGNGILVTARDATGTVRAKIQNNNVAAPLTGNRNGIRVDAGNAVSVNDSVCLNISGNTSAGVGLSPEGIGLRKEGVVAATNNFALHGFATSPANQAQTAAYVTAQNPGSALGTLIINGANFNQPTCSFP